MPYHPRKVSKEDVDILKKKHAFEGKLTKEDVEMILLTADTMDLFQRYAIFIWDINDNLHLVDVGESEYLQLTEEHRKTLNDERAKVNKPPVVVLEDIIRKTFLEVPIGIALVDAGRTSPE